MSEQLSFPGFDVYPRSLEEDIGTTTASLSGHAAMSGAILHPSIYPVDAEGWPWPLKVYTLGRFSLVRNGVPVSFGRKSPKRALDMLKAIIALGGRDISLEHLGAVLWPDSEGDAAQRLTDSNLYRLRKLLDDDKVVEVAIGRVSLRANRIWVDVWAFERTLRIIEKRMLPGATASDPAILQWLSLKVLRLYQKHFLDADQDAIWSVSMRERLRRKFIHLLIELGVFWEKESNWPMAILCYQKGLDVDDLVETFYQRLMICHQKAGRPGEGITIYRRCSHLLSVVLGIQPAPETQKIYQSLLHCRSSQKAV